MVLRGRLCCNWRGIFMSFTSFISSIRYYLQLLLYTSTSLASKTTFAERRQSQMSVTQCVCVLTCPTLTFPADVVPGREEDGLEAEHELAQEPRLRVLEDLHPLQRVQVHVDSDLAFQFICKSEMRIRICYL